MALLPGVQGDDVQAVFVGVEQVFQVVLDALEFGASDPDFWHAFLARDAVAVKVAPYFGQALGVANVVCNEVEGRAMGGVKG